MARQGATKTTLFLMELMVVILFFSICAAICLNVFSAGQKMAKESDHLSNAVMEVQSAASCYKAAQGDLVQTAVLWDGTKKEHAVVRYYDEEWKSVNQKDAVFAVQICALQTEGEAQITAQSTSSGGTLFTLLVKASRGGTSNGRN